MLKAVCGNESVGLGYCVNLSLTARKARTEAVVEMKDLLTDLDREMDDRDRRRALENQEREEHAQEDWARESARLNERLLDLNLLMQVIQRLPVPQAHGQYPSHDAA
ncbi:hypothetical protein AALO_G00005750 [Alosa alosa]|uniref:Uncharacterized protein n=1 Tax=Alosa alosa TaxID=278164 RepID=A0AAV6HEJ9_9TELE|nr:hypothetical protein AALO_G00005750 [Alosa alosa]